MKRTTRRRKLRDSDKIWPRLSCFPKPRPVFCSQRKALGNSGTCNHSWDIFIFILLIIIVDIIIVDIILLLIIVDISIFVITLRVSPSPDDAFALAQKLGWFLETRDQCDLGLLFFITILMVTVIGDDDEDGDEDGDEDQERNLGLYFLCRQLDKCSPCFDELWIERMS